MKIFNLLRNKKSQVLITAIIVVALVLVIGASLLFHGRSFRDVSKGHKKTMSAYSLAKSGIEMAKRKIKTSVPPSGPPGSCSGESGGPGGSGSGEIQPPITYNVDSGGEITIEATDGAITSIAKIDGTIQVLTETVPIPTGGGGGGGAATTWAKIYGRSGGEQYCWSIEQTSDSKYIFMGPTGTNGWGWGYGDIVVGRLLEDGNLDTSFGTNGLVVYGEAQQEGLVSYRYKILPLSSGDYVFAAATESFGKKNKFDIALVKINNSGNIVWQFGFDGALNEDWFGALKPTLNSAGIHDGYIIGGYGLSYNSVNEIYLIRTDLNGNLVTDGSFGGTKGAMTYGKASFDLYCHDLQQTFDSAGNPSGYVIVGSATSGTVRHMLLIKVSASGAEEWTKEIYSSGAGIEELYSVQQTFDSNGNPSGYLVGGRATIGPGAPTYTNGILIQTLTNGTINWVKTYDTGNTFNDDIENIKKTDDGYALAGFAVNSGFYDAALIKVNDVGVTTWAKLYGNGSNETFRAIDQTSDGGYILGGGSKSWSIAPAEYEFLFIKVDAFGELCCSLNISKDPLNFTETPHSSGDFTILSPDLNDRAVPSITRSPIAFLTNDSAAPEDNPNNPICDNP
ncbi:MAG: hypothetical protein ABIA97_03775 [Candidatus Omnitrophota bacterium]